MKMCKSCLVGKSLDEFYSSPVHRDGFQSYCKSCSRAAKRLWRQKNRARELTYNREWKAKNPQEYEKHKEEHRYRSREVTYGITRADFDTMLSAQGGKCAIGGHDFGDSAICVDHCHKSGVVRGLLCTKHNLGLGLFHDSPDELNYAAEYLAARVICK